ncbi:hypothetical protein PAAG_12198 [Paracoccidioides lutzii Pb01]|uniref:Uncharacterized protein n=1 Tax=Paracoccidioides lutzii (strain ATCC MYA-826 / Pb01) TaxID=502779 RepID=A0A0A2VJX9_PARBA|nr:hypothetical protein PAAG_12198 [Paracoccidioides lutzii Pb01]KGQ01159.1 hypothetical protein PAAG_12198 [Paracoccidioides lutzii Pb01]
MATFVGHWDVATLLLKHGATPATDPPKHNRFGHGSVLHAAVIGNHLVLVDLLLKRSADGGHRNGEGKTAFDIAEPKGCDFQTLKLLREELTFNNRWYPIIGR